ncbi:MAG: CRISPR-associated endonuclease Cas1 [Prevotella sp.]|jgi:CRISPR-associated protein Cas1|nr:CRISPR-associated endonuclease Cas1 [Prevotella sp.]MCH4100198.1 CRISPR-associated endonuclease Cas1 [Prevotella sp.]MCI2088150.1 CRISPR-associated endonuclease Cas1 [Prevotella sp.]MCI2125675.1 CRISPR-associated endonuclease Cas1 [Prevotella sp.]
MELILNTYGVSLNRDNEGFVVTTKDGKQRIPADGIKSIQISRGAQITSDAVMLAVEHEIEIIFMDRSGNPIGRIWSPKYGSISSIRKGQLNFTFTHDAVDWIKSVIAQKIENQQALMLLLNTQGNTEEDLEINKSIRRLDDYRNKVMRLDGDVVSDIAAPLRGWEGQSSRIYFSTMNFFLPEAFRFKQRSQHPAMDVTNAFLNYGYGLLYGKIEGLLIKAGVDPYIGILHRDEYNRPVMVYDIIELYRVWVDYVVYTLIAQNAITDEFYSVQKDGSYWLESLGRRILIQSLNDYLDEKISQKGVTRSRLIQMNLYIQDLAQKLKKYEI